MTDTATAPTGTPSRSSTPLAGLRATSGTSRASGRGGTRLARGLATPPSLADSAELSLAERVELDEVLHPGSRQEPAEPDALLTGPALVEARRLAD